MKRRPFLLALALAAPLLLAPASQAQTNTVRAISPGSFDAIDISGSAVVRFEQGPRDEVLYEGDDTTQDAPELEVRNGKYRAYARQLDVERGRLVFTGGPVTDPGVDLRASRKVPGYKVGVLVRGLLRLPQLTLFSEPPLPQKDGTVAATQPTTPATNADPVAQMRGYLNSIEKDEQGYL